MVSTGSTDGGCGFETLASASSSTTGSRVVSTGSTDVRPPLVEEGGVTWLAEFATGARGFTLE